MQGLWLGNIFPMGGMEEGKNCFPCLKLGWEIEVKNI
jgi:hypothetical protein